MLFVLYIGKTDIRRKTVKFNRNPLGRNINYIVYFKIDAGVQLKVKSINYKLLFQYRLNYYVERFLMTVLSI
jgi:hypothetical protein